MVDQIIQLALDGPGKKLQTFEGAVGSNTVNREVVTIASPVTFGVSNAGVAEVLNIAPTTEYGIVVRNIPSGTQTVSGTVTANAGTGTFSIQATAALPASVRLSDGTAFYDGTKTAQLPSALVGGRLDSNIGAYGGTATTLGQKAMVSSVPVVIASDQSAIPVSQSGAWTVTANAGTGTFTVDQTDTATIDYDTGAGVVNQTVFGIALPGVGGPVAGGTATNPIVVDVTDAFLLDTTFTGRINTLGQKAMTASTPVVLASDQTVIPVSDNASSLTIDGNVGLLAGINNIGDVDVLTLPSLVAGTANIGDVDIAGTTKTIERAVIDFAITGDNTIIAADVSNKLKVLGFALIVGAATNLRWKSGAATNLSGLMNFGANMGHSQSSPASPTMHWFETAVNQALILNQSGTAQVGGFLVFYRET